MKKTAAVVIVLHLAVVVGCTPADSTPRGPTFTDASDEAGIRFTHANGATGSRFLPETTVGGAAWIDFDGDGLYDLYLVSGNEHPDVGGLGTASNRLFRNTGGGKFLDVTESAGVACHAYGAGVAVGDYDGDGLSDIYLTCYGDNFLYHNEGNGRFKDVTASAGVRGGKWSTSAAFLDYDLDGALDLYVCRYVDYDPTKKCSTSGTPTYCSPHEFSGVPDLLYRNMGNGAFEDVSQAAGVAIAGPAAGKSLGVVVLDYDDDGDPDIYVACDQVPNLLFRNEGNGKFTEVGLIANVAFSAEGASQAGMGVDSGDVDLDGRADIVVTNFSDEPNALYHNEGAGFFTEASKRFDLAGPTIERLGFGVLLFDADRDGDLDLYIANGHVQDNVDVLRPGRTFRQPDQLLLNDAGHRFVDVSGLAGDWFRRSTVSRSAAACDFDEDGDEDIVILSTADKAVLLRNDSAPSHWIAFKLVGTKSNRDGFGAKLTVHARRGAEAFRRVFECRSARSYASACDPRVRCGLGLGPVSVEKVEIRWPSRKLQALDKPEIDRVHRIVEP